jgi:hypothetical protein
MLIITRAFQTVLNLLSSLTLSSSTMTCSQISSIARLSLGIFSTEPFCSNPLFNLTSLWDASSCMLSIVGRNRQDGSIIVPHNSVQFDYKELSSYFLCIEAQFSDYSSCTYLKLELKCGDKYYRHVLRSSSE